MKIGIDARLIEETGVGRYIQYLIRELGIIDKKNSYVVFLRKKSFDSFKLPNSRWQERLAEVPWHSLTEQLVMPGILSRERLDLVHIPYHNPPIFYSGKMILTIHDLTILHVDTGRATTLPLSFYKVKRLGYWLELVIGLRRAKKIIAVSQATKQEIIGHFHIDPAKIVVTYEAAEEEEKSNSKKPLIKGEYILYVGNGYPHKNLEILLQAFKKLSSSQKLVLVGSDDFFYKRLRHLSESLGLKKSVIFFGPGTNVQLASLYTYAQALVFPSRMEGFGLPGVEAMAVGTPVVCSNIPVFREIYADACLMFDSKNPEDIAAKLNRIMEDKDLRTTLVARGKKQAARYSWRRMAQQTLAVYEQAVS